MNHKKLGRKLGVRSKHRKAMFRNMATELFRHDSIKTTDTRAKEIRRVAEKIITLAKDGSLHARRRAGSYIKDKEVLSKLFDSVAERYKDRPGGYTRIIKLGYRKGDNSPISLVELVQEEYKPKTKKKKTRAKTAKKDSGKEKKAGTGAKSSKKESAKDLGLDETSAEQISEETASEVKEANQTETKQESVPEEQEQRTPDTEPEIKTESKEEIPDKTDENKSDEPEEGDPDKDKKS